MHNGKIDKFRFEMDDSTNRIMIYEEGQGVEPVAFISVNRSISKKEFDIEIMDWYCKSVKY